MWQTDNQTVRSWIQGSAFQFPLFDSMLNERMNYPQMENEYLNSYKGWVSSLSGVKVNSEIHIRYLYNNGSCKNSSWTKINNEEKYVITI